MLAAGCDGGSDEPLATANAATSPVPSDPSIVTTDTYVTATLSIEQDATIVSPTPMTDAGTGVTSNTMVLDGAPVLYRMEAGYASDGSFVYNQTMLGTPGDPTREIVDPVRKISLRNGHLEFRDAQGQLMLGANGESGPELMTMLGTSTPPALQIINGIFLNPIPQVGATTSFDGSSYTVTSVQQTGDLIRIDATAEALAQGEPTVQQQRTYRKRGTQYVIEEVKTLVSEAVNGAQMSGAATIRFANLQWNRNVPQDDARAGGASNTWGSASFGPPYEPTPCDPSAPICDPPEPDPYPTVPGGPPPPPVPTGPLPSTGGTAECPTTTGGANLVFVHGINSDGRTWGEPSANNRVRGLSRCNLQVGFELAPSLPDQGHGHHATQQSALRNHTTAYQQNQHIFIGHSQGGLISRRVAHEFQTTGRANLVRGVVTIGTPHQGAPVVLNQPSSVPDVLIRSLGREILCRILTTCSQPGSIVRAAVQYSLIDGAGTDAAADLAPNSPAIIEINNRPETFERYGIQHYPDKRWAFARVGGDAIFLDGGPAAVTTFSVVYYSAIGISVATFFLGRWSTSAFYSRLAYQLHNTDVWYNRITAGPDRSDGVVPGTSQVYPGALFNFEAANPTSHTGETKTQRSYDEVRNVLVTRFGVLDR